MLCAQNIAEDTLSALDRARQVLCAQMQTLVRLAAIAMRMVDTATRRAVEPDRPCANVLLRTVNEHVRIFWALRLIRALRAKLTDDLASIDRGEIVDAPAEATEAGERADKPERGERGESEREDRESFGRYLSSRSGDAEFAQILKRPTEEVLGLIREALGLADGKEADWDEEEEGEAPDAPLPLEFAQADRPIGAAADTLSGIPPPHVSVRFV